MLQIRKTRGWDQESFDQCLRAFEEKVAGDALRDQQAHDVDDIKRENAFLKRTLQNTGDMWQKIAAISDTADAISKLKHYAANYAPYLRVG